MEFDPNNKPHYVFKHPFRFVKPYIHQYKTFTKQRWLGRKLIELLSKQFQAYSEEYFQKAIVEGKVRVNGEKVQLDYIVRNSDAISHLTIREEPPILDLPIEIIEQTQEFLIVSKPPSMVVHTGGGYHYNSLLTILHYEMGFKNLFVLHRLDRLTSGVVILGKNKQKATNFHVESMEEVMKKCYIARVAGDFPHQNKVLEVPMICLSHKEGIWDVYNNQTMVHLLKNQKPKDSVTKFVKIWYDENSDSSLLQCYPVTGRTHQIRVHLKYIGYSILNDNVYGGRFVGNKIIQYLPKIKENVENEKQVKDEVTKKTKGAQQQVISDDQIDFDKWDYISKPLQICLHSIRYQFEGKDYKSRQPYWTKKQAFTYSPDNKLEANNTHPKSKYEIDFLKAPSKSIVHKKQEKQSQKQ